MKKHFKINKDNTSCDFVKKCSTMIIKSTKKRIHDVKMFMMLLSTSISLLICDHVCAQSEFPVQNKKMGLAMKTEITSDGYGIQYLPSFFYKYGRKSYFIAPTIQKVNMKIFGLQLNYEYSITGTDVPKNEDCKRELFVFADAAYHYNAKMGKGTSGAEQMSNPLFKDEFSFTSIEGYIGFGLRIPFLNRFRWSSMIGIGGYYSIDFPHNFIYYEGHNIGLLFSTGISVDVKSFSSKTQN